VALVALQKQETQAAQAAVELTLAALVALEHQVRVTLVAQVTPQVINMVDQAVALAPLVQQVALVALELTQLLIGAR
jgi:hypothetical protein